MEVSKTTSSPSAPPIDHAAEQRAQTLAENRRAATAELVAKADASEAKRAEQLAEIREAILREKRIKKWRRAWKVELIETANPTWRDLAPDIGL